MPALFLQVIIPDKILVETTEIHESGHMMIDFTTAMYLVTIGLEILRKILVFRQIVHVRLVFIASRIEWLEAVMMDVRDGAQKTPGAWVLVKTIPLSASLSRLGVFTWESPIALIMSFQSSTTRNSTFGRSAAQREVPNRQANSMVDPFKRHERNPFVPAVVFFGVFFLFIIIIY